MVDQEDVNKHQSRKTCKTGSKERGAFWDCLSILSAEIGEENREKMLIVIPLNETT